METFHLGLSIPRSLTLCILSGCKSLCFFPSAAAGSFSDGGLVLIFLNARMLNLPDIHLAYYRYELISSTHASLEVDIITTSLMRRLK